MYFSDLMEFLYCSACLAVVLVCFLYLFCNEGDFDLIVSKTIHNFFVLTYFYLGHVYKVLEDKDVTFPFLLFIIQQSFKTRSWYASYP